MLPKNTPRKGESIVKVIGTFIIALLFAGCATKATNSELRARATELRKEAREVETGTLQQECDVKRKERDQQVLAAVADNEKDVSVKAINLKGVPVLPDFCRNEGEKDAELSGRVNDIVLRPEKK